MIYEYYGATEGGGTLVTPQEWLERPGTVGRAWAGADVRVLDDEGKECPAGQTGAVYLKLMGDFAYKGDEQKTRANRRGEFFTVGDVGYLDDRRTGAARSRTSIASFFNNGARARGLVSNGPDGVAGNADDVLVPTGETLAQVQARVLGPTGAAVPLFREVTGYAVFGVRGAVRFGASHEVLFDFENLGDENYRGISWGMDAPGRGLYLRYALRF